MAGFLNWDDPNQQAISALAAGFLGGHGSFSNIAGNALAGGMQAYNQANRFQQERQLNDIRMKQYQAAQADAARKQAIQEKLQARIVQMYPNDPTKALAAQLAPDKFAESVFAQPKPPTVTDVADRTIPQDAVERERMGSFGRGQGSGVQRGREAYPGARSTAAR